MSLVPVFLGLASALFWGTADFLGGRATRRAPARTVALLVQGVGLVALLPLVAASGEELPQGRGLFFAALAGGCVSVGLTSLYRALSSGTMAVSASVSGLLAAAVPVVYGAASLGLPSLGALLGFFLAGVAIWLVASGEEEEVAAVPFTSSGQRAPLKDAALAGLGFGGFFVFLHLAGEGAPLAALLVVRGTCVLLLGALYLVHVGRGRRARTNAVDEIDSDELPSLTQGEGPGGGEIHGGGEVHGGGEAGRIGAEPQPVAERDPSWRLFVPLAVPLALAGLLDVGANLLFLFGASLGRIDIVAVLSSLYPAATALSARLFLGERLAPRQRWGVMAALLAIVLITR